MKDTRKKFSWGIAFDNEKDLMEFKTLMIKLKGHFEKELGKRQNSPEIAMKIIKVACKSVGIV